MVSVALSLLRRRRRSSGGALALCAKRTAGRSGPPRPRWPASGSTKANPAAPRGGVF